MKNAIDESTVDATIEGCSEDPVAYDLIIRLPMIFLLDWATQKIRAMRRAAGDGRTESDGSGHGHVCREGFLRSEKGGRAGRAD